VLFVFFGGVGFWFFCGGFWGIYNEGRKDKFRACLRSELPSLLGKGGCNNRKEALHQGPKEKVSAKTRNRPVSLPFGAEKFKRNLGGEMYTERGE